MTNTEFERIVKETNHWPQHKRLSALYALALAGEVGEYCNQLKKFELGKPLAEADLVEELGDILWYYTALLQTYNVTLDEIMEYNANKVLERSSRKSHYSQSGKVTQKAKAA
jgi:NTP pyrophosphatase (non-canonical NTP hydrolase)